MKRLALKQLCQRLAPVGIIVALGLSFLVIRNGEPHWFVLLLLAVWLVVFVGNLLILGGEFLRGARPGEKWFAAVLLAIVLAAVAYSIFGP